MYVIIDWHVLNDNNPNTYKSEAIEFFQEMSKKYASYDNVLYEICNEPNGATTWADVKSYATDVISEIRKNDSDAVILVGTPTWSQDVDAAAADRIANDENVMYVLHFYAATHKDDLRNKLVAAHKAGLPVFISEFSICDASGNGSVDYDSASKWLSLIQDYNISYVGWNLSNKAESSALLKSSCTKISGFSESDLSETGKWLFESFSK
jgi:endoglucanase